MFVVNEKKIGGGVAGPKYKLCLFLVLISQGDYIASLWQGAGKGILQDLEPSFYIEEVDFKLFLYPTYLSFSHCISLSLSPALSISLSLSM